MRTSPVPCWEVKWLSWPVCHHEFHFPHLLFLRVCWLFKAERINLLLFKSVLMTLSCDACVTEQNTSKFYSLSKYFCSELTAAEVSAWSLFLWLSLYSLYKRKINVWRELRLFFSLPRTPKYRNGANILVRPKNESTMEKHTYTKGEEVSDTPKHVRVQEQSEELGWVSGWRSQKPFLSCSGTYFSVSHWSSISKLHLPLCWSSH